jgi:hypothetical protein
MFKRVFVAGLLASTMATIFATSAEAHYIYVSGRLLYHSLVCSEDLKGVANPDTNPALTECIAEVAVVETLCENPTNHQISPGRSATQVVLVGEDQLDQSNITGKGKARVEVLIEDDSLLNPEFCVNPNWNPIVALARDVTIRLNNYECKDDACTDTVLATTAVLHCVLPPQYTVQNLPVQGTPYQCTQVSSTHVK